MSIPCVYCLENNELRGEQILLRGKFLYLCAPLGQMIEGYLVIAPYRCLGAFSRAPASYLDELEHIKTLVADFYSAVYGAAQSTFYEQGRAGGGALVDRLAGFPLHAHLCGLPRYVDLHTALSRELEPKRVESPHDLPATAGDAPYAYVEAGEQRVVYLPRSSEQWAELETKRLKYMIAKLVGLPERASWRAYPGNCELKQLIERWRNAWPN